MLTIWEPYDLKKTCFFLPTPRKINMVHLKITQLKSGKSSEPSTSMSLASKSSFSGRLFLPQKNLKGHQQQKNGEKKKRPNRFVPNPSQLTP